MTRPSAIIASAGGGRTAMRLCGFLLLMLASMPALAVNCSDEPFNGLIDGDVHSAPSQIQIDGNCTIRNFPAENPLTTNFSFFTQPGQNVERWLVIFDNVVHTGNMSCNDVQGHRIWFTNGSSSKIKEDCQNLLIPVEKIDKRNPEGQSTATVGVPFTYTMTIPVLFDPATDTVIDDSGSPNELHSVFITDDLNATGADLIYLGHELYWRDTGDPVPHTFSNDGGLLTFDAFPIIPAGEQILLELTVVLDDTPANAPGTQFVNTAEWQFGRLIDDEFFEPLPGENGVTEPMTIAAPELVVTKTGPDLLGGLNLGEWGEFTIEARNDGLSGAWAVTILDRLPSDPSDPPDAAGGMCDMTPEILGVGIAATDADAPQPLPEGSYTVDFTGAPDCELSVELSEAAGPIGPSERLVVEYRSKLDADSENGAVLTNVAGAIEWFNDTSDNADRQTHTCPLTDGTVGIDDCQDAHSVMVLLSGFFFEKTVANLDSGADPATVAAPGERLRYTLRLQTTDDGLDDFAFHDVLDAMNTPPAFAPGTLTIVSPLPDGAIDASDPTGGPDGTGVVDIRNMSLPAWSELQLQFDVTLDAGVSDGTVVSNQSDLLVGGAPFAVSNDPNVNGQADPAVVGDEEPTRVTVVVPAPDPLVKANTQPTATIGETFRYRVTIPAEPHEEPLHDVRILDDLAASAADLIFVGVTRIEGSGSWNPTNTGTDTELVIEDPIEGIDIPAGEQIVLDIEVALADSETNVAGLTFTNTAAFTFNRVAGDASSQDSGEPGTTEPMTIVEPELTLEKSGPSAMQLGTPETFTLDIHNVGEARAWGVTVTDLLADTESGGMCQAGPSAFTAQLFAADGTTPVSGVLEEGSDFVVEVSEGPDCTFTLTLLSEAATIGPDERLIVTYETRLDDDTTAGASLTNVAGATEWLSLEPSASGRSYTRAVTDGTVGVLDHEDAHTVVAIVPPDGLVKANTQATATIGETFSYRITVPAEPHEAPLHDVRILDDLGASAADLAFLGVTRIEGSGGWTPVNTGTDTELVIEDPVDGIDIPAGEQIVIEIDVRLEDTATNVAGLTFTNTASYSFNALEGDEDSRLPGTAGTTEPMTVVEPELTLEKRGPPQMRLDTPGTFTLDIHNAGGARAWAVSITDLLPSTATGGMCDTAPSAFTARIFEADGTTPVSEPLVEGSDFTVGFAGEPDCLFTLALLSQEATIGPDERLIVTYETRLDDDSEQGTTLTNIAGATEWFGADPSDPEASELARDYTRELTDGTVGVLDHEDAHTVLVQLAVLVFEKTVANVSRGEDPATLATPGETLRYHITIDNIGEVGVNDVTLRDELDRLNDSPAFQAGTLNLISVPAGADTSGTDPFGGADGTGLLELANLTLGAGESIEVEIEIELAPVLTNERLVLNQSQLLLNGIVMARSDDPNVGGPADPLVFGDEEPTRIRIESAPEFRVEKVSAYVTGDPDVLLAGETLRYTITVKNVGTDHAHDAVLRDEIPANTAYVPESTTLNGAPVPDASGGGSPLSDGIALHAPENPTDGFLRADASEDADNVATVVFDVIVNEDVADGTVISNQGFVSAPEGGVSDQPSNDPRTPVPDDPTRDVVGNAPLLHAEKSARLIVDEGTPGIVDPGDVLRYTFEIHNQGRIPATDVVLTDEVPNDTTYVADSLTVNGEPVGRPDGGELPLASGIPVSSSDLTPPQPDPGEGTLNPGETAVVEFDVRVNDGVPAGTLIINQGVVTSEELGNLLTDGDGNPATGPQPTIVVVGDSQQLTITKDVAVVGGGPVLAGSTLEYIVRVANVASVPALEVIITDDLDVPVAGQLTLVEGSARMDGSTAGVSVAGSTVTADYAAIHGELPPGESTVLRFRAVVDPDLAIGTTVTNTAEVSWNSPAQTESASVSVDVGGTPGVGSLAGTAWHDADFDRTLDGDERVLEGWAVDLYRNGARLHSTVTGTDGTYRIEGIAPNEASGDEYEIRFRAPGATERTAALGRADSPFTDGPQSIRDILVPSGGTVEALNLPIDPNGVVYDAITRMPVAGATVTLLQGTEQTPVPASCLDDPAQQGQITLAGGHYKFDLNFSGPECPSGGSYVIEVTVPPSGYIEGPSRIIPPAWDDPAAPFDVPACPGSADDAVPATAEHCEAQASELAPPPSVRARTPGTRYHRHLTFDASLIPGSSQIFNNHVPIDPELDDAVAISKTSSLVNVSRGQLVPYTITVRNTFGMELQDMAIVDRFPAGFRYVEGSARLDGVPVEPEQSGRELVWDDLAFTGSAEHTITLLLAVGAGVSEGEYVNRAQVVNRLSGSAVSGEATATVRVVPDPTFDCTDVYGKVFDDASRSGSQDPGERGLAGVRVVSARGLTATTDEHGRFHITCAITPRDGRGNNFVLKVDDRTLPSGYRISGEQVQVQRATRGKALRFNFSASIDRVVGLDVADAVFEPGTTEMRHQWRPRIPLLIEQLEKAPARLRISYLADLEAPRLVERRLDAIKAEISEAWKARDCCYALTIETEVFWRHGAPPQRRRGSSR